MDSITLSHRLPGSFRDPAGFVFSRQGTIFRQVNQAYRKDYDHLTQSGLYDALVSRGLLVAYSENGEPCGGYREFAYKVVQPEAIPFISYPYEWCFSQLKDAALAVLAVQRMSLKFGMTLKDASAYNMQFTSGKFKLIDLLSFERYEAGQPWVAYRQFCQHFLAPLSLISLHHDGRLALLLRDHLDGIPLDLAAGLLPFSAKFKFSLLSHLFFHSRSQRFYQDKEVDLKKFRMPKLHLEALLDSLESAVRGLSFKNKSAWARYYDESSYSSRAMASKKEIVSSMLGALKPAFAFDLGANTGVFSRLCRQTGAFTVSLDSDHGAVEENYLACIKDGDSGLLPLVVDLVNPSPAIGWENQERMSFLERRTADTVLALGVVHHLAFSNNLPLGKIAAVLSRLGNSLVVEFVSKEDRQSKRLLSSRRDIFPDYTQESFEREFSRYFLLQDSRIIKDSCRTVYLFTKK